MGKSMVFGCPSKAWVDQSHLNRWLQLVFPSVVDTVTHWFFCQAHIGI